jgi:hypothetical protein
MRFQTSGVKTPEENANFMSCLKARPTKLRRVVPAPANGINEKRSRAACHWERKLTGIALPYCSDFEE